MLLAIKNPLSLNPEASDSTETESTESITFKIGTGVSEEPISPTPEASYIADTENPESYITSETPGDASSRVKLGILH